MAGIGPGLAVAATGVGAGDLLRGLVLPALPPGSAGVTLGLMGGIGGSVTLLSYGYWVREHGWSGAGALRPMRLDLFVGYLLTGIFGVATLVLATAVLAGSGGMPPGSEGLVGEHRSRLLSTAALVAALALFVATGIRELLDLAGGG
jgi:hypothetical protein